VEERFGSARMFVDVDGRTRRTTGLRNDVFCRKRMMARVAAIALVAVVALVCGLCARVSVDGDGGLVIVWMGIG
jgi:hypothetical protein